MGERLAGGNVALALLGNTLPTGAILVVLILASDRSLARISISRIARDEPAQRPPVARILSVRRRANCRRLHWTLVAHGMFELPLLESRSKRARAPRRFAEFVATFGLIVTILAVARFKSEAIPVAVGLYITAAYWFTASTSFANPAVTIARALTNSFSGIAPADVPMFIVAQFVGALAGLGDELVFQGVRRSRASPARWSGPSALGAMVDRSAFIRRRRPLPPAGSRAFALFRRSLPRCSATNPNLAANLMTVFASALRSGRVRTSWSISSPMKTFFLIGGVATAPTRASSFRADSYARKLFECFGAPTRLGLSRTCGAHTKAGAYDALLGKMESLVGPRGHPTTAREVNSAFRPNTTDVGCSSVRRCDAPQDIACGVRHALSRHWRKRRRNKRCAPRPGTGAWRRNLGPGCGRLSQLQHMRPPLFPQRRNTRLAFPRSSHRVSRFEHSARTSGSANRRPTQSHFLRPLGSRDDDAL